MWILWGFEKILKVLNFGALKDAENVQFVEFWKDTTNIEFFWNIESQRILIYEALKRSGNVEFLWILQIYIEYCIFVDFANLHRILHFCGFWRFEKAQRMPKFWFLKRYIEYCIFWRRIENAEF
jgi:hypothetical protein